MVVKSKLVLVSILGAVTLGISAHAADLEVPSPSLFDESKILEGWSTLKRWLIEYEVRPTGSSPMHRVMAFSAPGDVYTLSAHFPGTYPWQEDPYAQELFVHGGMICNRWPFNRNYSQGVLAKGAAIPGSFPQDVVLPVIPVWPITDYKAPISGISGVIEPTLEALRSGNYHVLTNSDVIAGENCIVFEKTGVDRMWLSKSKSLCVMRRETMDPRYGKTRQRTLTERVEQIAPGLWLPSQFKSQFLSLMQSTNKEDIIEVEFKVQILRCVLDEMVPDSTFIPINPPGSCRYDREKVHEFTQQSDGGEDLLSHMAQFMVKYLHLPQRGHQNRARYFWLLGGLVTGVWFGLILIPERDKVKNATSDKKVIDSARAEH